MRVIVAPQAKADVVAIGEYIRPDNPERADSFVQELLDHCHALGGIHCVVFGPAMPLVRLTKRVKPDR